MSDAAEPAGRVERLARRPLEHVGGVIRGVLRALPKAIEDMFNDRCGQYAAAIAYRVLFSLFPLTIALVSIFGLVLQDDAVRQRVINELIRLLPVSESGEGNIQRSIEQIATPLSAIGLISLVALLWGATGMMASIRLGLETALKVDRGRPAARVRKTRNTRFPRSVTQGKPVLGSASATTSPGRRSVSPMSSAIDPSSNPGAGAGS